MNVYNLSGFVSFSLPTNVCFIVVAIATVFLVINLKRSSSIRAKMVAKTTERDSRVVVTVISISLIYIVGFTPYFILHLLTIVYPPFNNENPFLQNALMVLFSFSVAFQLLSSSINVFVYLWTNSRYRTQFSTMFGCKPSAGTRNTAWRVEKQNKQRKDGRYRC